mmetsp:Transcript_7282/g.28671  ORF Transcript_7282/g.28671 Transcript_7282/m.28671 type:complete len:224 (+) Transcript_7282:681-1352(+)
MMLARDKDPGRVEEARSSPSAASAPRRAAPRPQNRLRPPSRVPTWVRGSGVWGVRLGRHCRGCPRASPPRGARRSARGPRARRTRARAPAAPARSLPLWAGRSTAVRLWSTSSNTRSKASPARRRPVATPDRTRPVESRRGRARRTAPSRPRPRERWSFPTRTRSALSATWPKRPPPSHRPSHRPSHMPPAGPSALTSRTSPTPTPPPPLSQAATSGRGRSRR